MNKIETQQRWQLRSLVRPRRMRHTCADLFAGAGGLSVGFEAAGFRTVFFNEIDETAAQTFMFNFPDAVPFVQPVQELTSNHITDQCSLPSGELDILMGGPPCQGFSINAPVRKRSDPRNHLFRNYIRLLGGLRPKYILMENVPGLVSLAGGETLHDVLLAFEREGYRVIFRILNAAHYGVPEERWRLFFIGTRLPDVELSFPEPICYCTRRPNFAGGREYTFRHAVGRPSQPILFGTPLLPPTTVGEAISDLPPVNSGGGTNETPYIDDPQGGYQTIMRESSPAIFNHECMALAKINLTRMQHVKPGGSWRDIPRELLPEGLKKARRSDHTRRYGRLDPESPSGTILTKCDPHWGTFVHNNQNRVITIREAARIQSFPDWFRFTGSKIHQYRQVGNAVPPLLARHVADQIVTNLKKIT